MYTRMLRHVLYKPGPLFGLLTLREEPEYQHGFNQTLNLEKQLSQGLKVPEVSCCCGWLVAG